MPKGRPRIPDEEKARRGTLRPMREFNAVEQPALTEVPPPPEGMEKTVKDLWCLLAAQFFNTGILKATDLFGLKALVYAIDTINRIQPLLYGNEVIKNTRGDLIKNPLTVVLKENIEVLKFYGNKFGMTPLERQNVVADKIQEDKKGTLKSLVDNL